MFQVAPATIQRINASRVEVVALIRRVYFYVSSQKLMISFRAMNQH
jgi:hypothetical protein